MSFNEWISHVNDLLKCKGVVADEQSDGWEFLWDNGITPLEAIENMMF